MKQTQNLQTKILPRFDLKERVKEWKKAGQTVVFTNGCFDILHTGHIASLLQAAQQGDKLIVALNADSSVKKLKGDSRPINDENARSLLMAALCMVDAVTIFNEPTPLELIVEIQPDVLVKGGDYKVEEIAGAKEVLDWGGKVFITPIVEGFSTTNIIEKMRNPDT